MNDAVRIAAIVIIVVLAGSPLFFSRLLARRFHRYYDRRIAWSYAIVLAICTLVFVVAIMFRREIPFDNPEILGHAARGCFYVFLACGLIGPIATGWMLLTLRVGAGHTCVRCDYDLTGNVTGVCSECGFPRQEESDSHGSIRRLRKRSVLALLFAVATVGVLIGYRESSIYMACTKCADHASTTDRILGIPFLGAEVTRYAGRVVYNNETNRVLTRMLDPGGRCDHSWHIYAERFEDIDSYTWPLLRGGGDFTRCLLQHQDDFGLFIAEHPGVLDRIRLDLAMREHFDTNWLFDEYLSWHDSRRD